jgi:hypothetical protein
MNKIMCFLLSVTPALVFSGTVLAEDYEYHPALSDNFTLMLGAFKSDNSFRISADGTITDEIENRVDFDDSVGV